MRFPLKTRVSLFVLLSIVGLSVPSTLLFARFFRATAEREIIARGAALSQSLARAAAQGLAAEDLDLLDKAAYIVQAEDVLFALVYSSVWSPVQAYPFEALRLRPSPQAIDHFKLDAAPFLASEVDRYDFYVPIVLKLPPASELTIGYARLALSTASLRQALRSVILGSLLIAAAITVLCVVITHYLIGRTVVAPILRLHRAVELLKEHRVVADAPAAADDEIADLSREFAAMGVALRDREQRLSEEKERLAVTLRSIGDGVIVTDEDGRISLLNRVAEELTGWSTQEAAGRPFCEVFTIHHEKTREPCENLVARVMATGGIVSFANHTALTRRDGTDIVIEDAAAPIRDPQSQIIGVVLAFRDVTERRRMEAELLKAEKLRALGVLAGGIAHDFNNLLTGMLGNISLARLDGASGEQLHARLEEAEVAARRAADLTAQLLTFSRGGAPMKKVAFVADVLEESARFILSGTNIAARYDVAADTWPVEIDAGQMSQVFNNLTLNAVNAMPKGGSITFTVGNVQLDARELPPLEAGNYVCITVRDEGTGIAPEHLGRIFDPYFTTSSAGVGLGLTSAHSIVKKHDGQITVASLPGRGTTFRIYLPAACGAAPPPPPEKEELRRGEGAVLVMDDEPVVRGVAAEILHSLGYEAVTAKTGEEALELYQHAREHGRPFRAVILDLTIPGGMGGKEAVRRLLALDPEARVIVSSGYSHDPVMADFLAHGFKGVIVKPYGAKAFGRTLHEVLDGSA